MIVLAGYWDLGYSSPLREAERWSFMLKDFGVTQWHMIPISGIKHSPLVELAEIQEVFDAYPNYPAVFMDEKASNLLTTFIHPTNAIYIFGKSGYSPLAHKRTQDFTLKINTPASVGGLWGDQAASLVLYDRLVVKA